MNNRGLKPFLFVLICIIVLALVMASVSWHENAKLRRANRELSVQLAHANIPIKVDTIRDSIPVYTQQIVEVDSRDYKKQIADRDLIIKDLNLKVAQIEAENRTLIANQGQAVLQPTVGKDSDSILSYKDQWARFTYEVKPRKLTYNVRDSLVTFVVREYRHRFLWWRWGTKGYQVKLVNFNPNSVIEYNSYIKVKK